MTLTPDNLELLTRAQGDLRSGLAVVLCDEDQGALIASTETLCSDRLVAMQAYGPKTTIAITARRAVTLKTPVYDGDVARIALPANVDIAWIVAIADPATDLNYPMKGPLKSLREGCADLHRLAIAITKSARLLPAAVVSIVADPMGVAQRYGLTLIQQSYAVSLLKEGRHLMPVTEARLPLSVSERGRLHVFRPDDGGEEHYAVEIGRPDRSKPVLTRLHSACFTGDVLGSLKCDCGAQLQAALALMGEEGSGILLYLNQEGRGIGLANKLRAYSLQDQGFDTVEANHRLGFEDDERDFRLGSSILKSMGFSTIRLLTNNPAKVDIMVCNGIAVSDRIPLKVGHTEQNREYLAVKSKKMGHIL
ncbi:MAG: GTP cyclohydrolase II [Aestuariivita sp.]|nr:GTP cyclohydrolase II [Aestuariivita sp.]